MSNRRVESFLLRLVVEERNAADVAEWRGRIQHVSSGYERQFESLEDMIAFIGEQLFRRQTVAGTQDEWRDAE